jgi:ubiquilin
VLKCCQSSIKACFEGIQDGHSIHLVKGTAAAAPSRTTPLPPPVSAPSSPFAFGTPQAGAVDFASMQRQLQQNPEMMQAAMDSPMMRNMFDNPELLRSMFNSNPQIRAMMEANPQLSQIYNDPALFRQSMEAIRNPQGTSIGH